MIVELAIDNNHVLKIKLEVDTNPPLAQRMKSREWFNLGYLAGPSRLQLYSYYKRSDCLFGCSE